MRVLQPAPATPTLLSVCAAMVPATWLPWNVLDVGVLGPGVTRVGVEAVTVQRSVGVADEVVARRGQSAAQIGMIEQHTRVDHGRNHVGIAGGRVPGLGQVDQGIVPLPNEKYIGWRPLLPADVVGLGIGHVGAVSQFGDDRECFQLALQLGIQGQRGLRPGRQG